MHYNAVIMSFCFLIYMPFPLEKKCFRKKQTDKRMGRNEISSELKKATYEIDSDISVPDFQSYRCTGRGQGLFCAGTAIL